VWEGSRGDEKERALNGLGLAKTSQKKEEREKKAVGQRENRHTGGSGEKK